MLLRWCKKIINTIPKSAVFWVRFILLSSPKLTICLKEATFYYEHYNLIHLFVTTLNFYSPT